MTTKPLIFPDRATWLAARPTFLGASEAPAVLGANPYSSALKVYTSKIEGVQEPETPAMRAGIMLEQSIAQLWAAEGELRLVHPSTVAGCAPSSYVVWQMPGQPFSCTPDSFAEDQAGLYLVEVKNVSPDSRAWHDGPPLMYQVQVQYQLMVLEACGVEVEHGYLVAFFGGADVREWKIEKDRELWAAMQSKLGQFWLEHIQMRVPPPPDKFTDSDAMRKAWPVSVDKAVEVGADLVRDYREKKQLADIAEEAADKAKVALQALMSDAERATCGGVPVITWKKQADRVQEPQPAKTIKGARPFKMLKSAEAI